MLGIIGHGISLSLASAQVPTLGSQEGAFENVRMNYSGDQGQTIRQLISAHVLRRVAMCVLSSPHGRRQHLAVSHEKGKVSLERDRAGTFPEVDKGGVLWSHCGALIDHNWVFRLKGILPFRSSELPIHHLTLIAGVKAHGAKPVSECQVLRSPSGF